MARLCRDPGTHVSARIAVRCVDSGTHMAMLLDALLEELRAAWQELPPGDSGLPGGFYNNRACILQAFHDRTLYGAMVDDSATPSAVDTDLCMRVRCAYPFPSASHWPGGCYLPAFAVVDAAGACDLIWTAARIRRRGVAGELLRALGVTRARNVVLPAVGFWTALGFVEEADEDDGGDGWLGGRDYVLKAFEAGCGDFMND